MIPVWLDSCTTIFVCLLVCMVATLCRTGGRPHKSGLSKQMSLLVFYQRGCINPVCRDADACND